jgi:hypothetical protein
MKCSSAETRFSVLRGAQARGWLNQRALNEPSLYSGTTTGFLAGADFFFADLPGFGFFKSILPAAFFFSSFFSIALSTAASTVFGGGGSLLSARIGSELWRRHQYKLVR